MVSNSSRLWDRFEDASHDNGMQMTSISNDAITALEAAEKRIAELENYAEAEAVGADKAAEDGLYWMKRCKELESRTVRLPDYLHPDTQELVINFCTALAEKLYKAQLKYGYDADWKNDGWPSQCQAHFHQHIVKGDPRDVAAYCAFMWWHGWSTKPAEGLESRTVTVKLPDYRNTYKSPLADEVEHQVRLALELFSSAAGIKVEAE
ncbi:TPA: hypothetical protein ACPUMQ_003179 [Klebsiella pneumoniae]